MSSKQSFDDELARRLLTKLECMSSAMTDIESWIDERDEAAQQSFVTLEHLGDRVRHEERQLRAALT